MCHSYISSLTSTTLAVTRPQSPISTRTFPSADTPSGFRGNFHLQCCNPRRAIFGTKSIPLGCDGRMCRVYTCQKPFVCGFLSCLCFWLERSHFTPQGTVVRRVRVPSLLSLFLSLSPALSLGWTLGCGHLLLDKDLHSTQHTYTSAILPRLLTNCYESQLRFSIDCPYPAVQHTAHLIFRKSYCHILLPL